MAHRHLWEISRRIEGIHHELYELDSGVRPFDTALSRQQSGALNSYRNHQCCCEVQGPTFRSKRPQESRGNFRQGSKTFENGTAHALRFERYWR